MLLVLSIHIFSFENVTCGGQIDVPVPGINMVLDLFKTLF